MNHREAIVVLSQRTNFIPRLLRVESVQKVFTEKRPGMRYPSYEERLSVLNVESLDVRRLKKRSGHVL